MTRRAIKNADEIKQIVCERIMDGETLTAICEEEGMPSRETLRQWAKRDDDFAENYYRAQEIRQFTWADEVVAIANEIPEGATRRDIARAKAQIDVLKWATGRVVGGMRGNATGNPSPATKRQRKLALAKQLRAALDQGKSLQEVIAELERE